MSLYAETIARLGHANALRPSLSPRSDAAKACARFVQPSRERETPLPPAASMRARYASRDSRLRSTMRSVTAARTGFSVGEKSTMVGCYRRQGADWAECYTNHVAQLHLRNAYVFFSHLISSL